MPYIDGYGHIDNSEEEPLLSAGHINDCQNNRDSEFGANVVISLMGRDTTLYHITAISPDMQRIRYDVISAGHETPRTIESDLKDFFAPATPCHLYEAQRCPACRCRKDTLEFDVGNNECDDCSDRPGNWKQQASNLI